MPIEIYAAKVPNYNKIVAFEDEILDCTRYVRADIAENKGAMKCFYEETELPKVFIAIYSDGSGCHIFSEHKDHERHYTGLSIDFDVCDKDWFIDAGYLWFVALPDDFNVFGGE
jgi:hypothetical protein